MTRRATVTDLGASALRLLLDSTPEHDLVLVDVREPEEYAAGHLPGAMLMPLLTLQTEVRRIPAVPIIVLYCRSGARSTRAAAFASMELGRPIYSLAGGILGWTGVSLPNLPNLRLFDASVGLAGILRQAMDLEKGAHRLYQALLPRFVGSAAEASVRGLLGGEEAHARALYELLVAVEPKTAEQPFEAVFAALPGELLESGASFEGVAAMLQSAADRGIAALLELALEMELRAYDLYRAAANEAASPDQHLVLLDLADQERGHAAALTRALAAVAR